MLLPGLFQLVRIRDLSSPICQQPSRPEPPAPFFLLHPPELTTTPDCVHSHNVIDGCNLKDKPNRVPPSVSGSFLHWKTQEILTRHWICTFLFLNGESIFDKCWRFVAQREHTWWENNCQSWTAKHCSKWFTPILITWFDFFVLDFFRLNKGN